MMCVYSFTWWSLTAHAISLFWYFHSIVSTYYSDFLVSFSSFFSPQDCEDIHLTSMKTVASCVSEELTVLNYDYFWYCPHTVLCRFLDILYYVVFVHFFGHTILCSFFAFLYIIYIFILLNWLHGVFFFFSRNTECKYIWHQWRRWLLEFLKNLR